MSADDGATVGVGNRLASARPESLRARFGGSAARWLFWLVGAAVVAAAQPTTDRRAAGAAAAIAGIAAVTLVRRLTETPATRYLRSLLAGILAVSIAADWGLRIGLGSPANGGTSFLVYGEAKRIILPFLFVLLAPLVIEALPVELRLRSIAQAPSALWERMRWMDWIVVAYGAIAVPAVLIGLAHHWRATFIAQDVGLVVFFVFVYIAGRASGGRGTGAWAGELVDVLLLVAVAQLVFFGWNIAPLYAYVEATCVGALVLVFMRPEGRRGGGMLRVGVAVTLLASEAVATATRSSTASTIALGLLMAGGVVVFVALRLRPHVPTLALIAVAAVAFVGILGFTHDGAALRGQYHGRDPSNIGRTYEARQVRAQARSGAVSFVLGRGFGSTIDETGAPHAFKKTLTTGGRDLAHVPEVHLLVYAFLLKEGLMGVVWLAVFGIGLAALAFQALERAARTRDPAFVVYAALPLIGIAAASAGASNLQANPLNGLTLGILVACLARPPGAAAAA
jgi:hypothetical protein